MWYTVKEYQEHSTRAPELFQQENITSKIGVSDLFSGPFQRFRMLGYHGIPWDTSAMAAMVDLPATSRDAGDAMHIEPGARARPRSPH